MTLRGLGWTPRGLRGQTGGTLRGTECGTWFLPWGQPCMVEVLPWGQPSVVMTWMVDWMVEGAPMGST